MGFNSAFKGLNKKIHILLSQVYCVRQVVKTPTTILNNPVLRCTALWTSHLLYGIFRCQICFSHSSVAEDPVAGLLRLNDWQLFTVRPKDRSVFVELFVWRHAVTQLRTSIFNLLFYCLVQRRPHINVSEILFRGIGWNLVKCTKLSFSLTL